MLSHLMIFSQRKCGSIEKMNHFFKLYPEKKINRIESEKKVLLLKDFQFKQSMTIPVVFHVVYNSPQQNISDQQIISQLDVLNADFNRTNADAVNTPNDFDTIVESMQIQFCLAKRTENGDPSTGIVRVPTNITEFQLYDTSIHYNSLGGSNAWNTDKYLNIWICNIGNSILGWAQFPSAGNINTDGVVIDYRRFGTIGTATHPYNLGRTTTHELGHYFNLYHTWGDNNCGDDFVYDTPIQEEANFGCKVHPHISCSNNGDMFMNFMDYTNDNCMNSFTKGQRDRVWNSIYTYRSNLISSNGCDSVNVSNIDASIEIIYPIGHINGCNNPIFPKVLITNLSQNNLFTAEIKYKINSSGYQYQYYNGNLSFGELDTISISALPIGGNNHFIEANLLNPNGQQDINLTNNNDYRLFTTDDGTQINITLNTDNYANETSWYLLDNNNIIIDSSENLLNNQYYIYNYCLIDNCYKLVVTDSEGDGFCCNYGQGNIKVNKILNNTELAQLTHFNYIDTIHFCVTSLGNIETEKIHTTIYPNPSNGIIYFTTKYENINNNIVKVFDINGRNIDNRKILGNKIDLSFLKNGIYFLEIILLDDIIRQKIIITKY